MKTRDEHIDRMLGAHNLSCDREGQGVSESGPGARY